MNLMILAIKDTKSGRFLPPFTAINTAVAIRELQEAVNANEKQSPWQKWPRDFDLYEVGIFLDETGTIGDNEEGVYPDFKINLGSLATA